jgi:hypothetical protein
MDDFRTHTHSYTYTQKKKENKCLSGMSNSTADRQRKETSKRDPSL